MQLGFENKKQTTWAAVLGVVALLGLCAGGGLVYGALGSVLGVVKLSELRGVLRRQPGVKPADPTEQP